MSDETAKPPSSYPPHPQHPNLGPSGGEEAQSAESLPTPQQLHGAPPRQAQSSIMQNNTPPVTAAAPSSKPAPPPPPPHPLSIPSLQEPTQPTPTPTTASDPRFPAMDNNPDIIMGGGGGGAAEQQQHHQHPPAPSIPPTTTAASGPTPKIRAGGAPARIFLNENVVPHLLEGMKTVTKDQPPNPLRALGEYLIQKSNEIEGGGGVDIKTE